FAIRESCRDSRPPDRNTGCHSGRRCALLWCLRQMDQRTLICRKWSSWLIGERLHPCLSTGTLLPIASNPSTSFLDRWWNAKSGSVEGRANRYAFDETKRKDA